jgi:hypothetical protein
MAQILISTGSAPGTPASGKVAIYAGTDNLPHIKDVNGVDGAIFHTKNMIESVATANTGTAYTVDITAGTLFDLTLTGNVTFTFPTATAGRQFTLLLKQDATGSRTITWPSAVRWPAGTAPTITSTAAKTDVISFVADGSYWLGFVGGQNWTRA